MGMPRRRQTLGPPARGFDTGLLGVAVLERTGARTWSTASFEVGAHAPVRAGIDGEAVVLTPPLRFCARKRVLRVRIARHHPGASPSAFVPGTLLQGVRALFAIARGRDR
jgi:hypothetical protein